jgi:hypothetical protein
VPLKLFAKRHFNQFFLSGMEWNGMEWNGMEHVSLKFCHIMLSKAFIKMIFLPCFLLFVVKFRVLCIFCAKMRMHHDNLVITYIHHNDMLIS